MNRFIRSCCGAALMFGSAALLSSCGGGHGSGSGSEQTLIFGPLVTRVSGTVEPPVTSGESGVVVTGVAGGNITAMSLEDTSPTLAETRIAFARLRDVNEEIYVMNADGSGQSRLTNNPAAFNLYPAWFPDGSKFAFTSSRDGNWEIYVMNADGSSQTRLTNNTAIDELPAWSPDGSKIAFDSNRDGNYEIYVMNADGSSQTRLTNILGNDLFPAWSPDGSKIAFISTRDGNWEIYVMNADGSGQTRLTNNPAYDGYLAWSPDGSKIVFTSSRDGNWEIYVMNADGSGQTRLTNNPAIDYDPVWSPDGSKIAFASNRDGNYEIYVMNADGSGQTRLTNNPDKDEHPAWSPFFKRRSLIGSAGSIGTNAAGFLFGQDDHITTSIVTFDATTRTSARVKAQTGLGDGLPNVVFSLSADNITKLAFVNLKDTVFKVNKVVGPGAPTSTATDALVSFSGSMGDVTSVIPYTSNRSIGAPSIKVEGGQRVYRGRFLGTWDGKGVNHAPNGATEVRQDVRSGAIVAVR